MALKTVLVCDNCEKIITGNSYAIRGNVYYGSSAELAMGNGIIGNHFPDLETFEFIDVRVSHFCAPCIVKVFKLHSV
jgi:hypothetical protein